MASSQCERIEEIAVQFGSEETVYLNEIMKQAECSLESQELMDESLGVVAKNDGLTKPKFGITLSVGALRNQEKEPKHIMDSKKYSGHIVRNFPDPLNGAGAFAMSAMSDKGVKAAVVYSGKNKTGVECGWLLAFADTKATGRRIYAECGRKNKFNNINWGLVEQKLNMAGKYAKAIDKETGTSVIAGIGGTNGKSVIGAAFCG